MKEYRDQTAHFAAAFVIVILANLLGGDIGVLSGALVGFAPGLSREIAEEGEVSLAALWRALGSRRDLTFWTLGGMAAGALSRIA